ncbi:hypothetical protein HBH64_070460 [Parastagonospora nodorum]|nr:hypothetical protein HBH51_131300 [Parastagonospora nodorum]KAH4051117.1 hypothetical protein HBH49_113410 [Parastagonospora nodorum]KAH4073892.1 hypothetical protein HBH50_039750 [Parastagonospora nodorum]KAH4091110.1 hypothetical protein HBH46_187230 [Parastagonospora nodorum]KAH4091405.1 hypothetical protein HBH48_092070 [Parastagonospora nodorum]
MESLFLKVNTTSRRPFTLPFSVAALYNADILHFYPSSITTKFTSGPYYLFYFRKPCAIRFASLIARSFCLGPAFRAFSNAALAEPSSISVISTNFSAFSISREELADFSLFPKITQSDTGGRQTVLIWP